MDADCNVASGIVWNHCGTRMFSCESKETILFRNLIQKPCLRPGSTDCGKIRHLLCSEKYPQDVAGKRKKYDKKSITNLILFGHPPTYRYRKNILCETESPSFPPKSLHHNMHNIFPIRMKHFIQDLILISSFCI